MGILAAGIVVFLYSVVRTLPRSLNKPKFRWVVLIESDPQLRALLLLYYLGNCLSCVSIRLAAAQHFLQAVLPSGFDPGSWNNSRGL